MGPLGFPELMLILVLALIVFGPRKLPEIGRTIGKALGEFKRATDDLKNTIEREVQLEELKQIGPNVLTSINSVSRSEPVPEVDAVATPVETAPAPEPPLAPVSPARSE